MSNKETNTPRRKTADRANIPKSQEEAYAILDQLEKLPGLIPEELATNPSDELMDICADTVSKIHIRSARIRAFVIDKKRTIPDLQADISTQIEMLNRLLILVIRAINILYYTHERVTALINEHNRTDLFEIAKSFNHRYKVLAKEKRSIECTIDILEFFQTKLQEATNE